MLQYMKVLSVFDLIDEAHVLLSHVKVISKIYTVTQPHHRIIVRFTIIYIGIWSSNDMLNLYVNDGTLGQNFAIKYDCRDAAINHTEIMCDRSGNRLDCIRDY